MSRSNVAGALQSPKAITVNCHKPPPGHEKAVFGLSTSDSLTCQYPDLRSNVHRTC